MLLLTKVVVFSTLFAFGHVAPNGNEPRSDFYRISGHQVSGELPARSVLTDRSVCHQVTALHVLGSRPRWNRGHTVISYGNRVAFDGMQIYNYSNKAAWVRFRIFAAC